MRRLGLALVFWALLVSGTLQVQAQTAPANSDIQFNQPLVDAADRGDARKVSELLRSGTPVDSAGKFNVTALMRAVFRGNADLVDMLLGAGANPNMQDIGGASAVHLAARLGYTEVMALLVQYRANINIADKEGWTPLMRAVSARQGKTVESLLLSGADVNLLNKDRESALMLAARRKDSQTVQLLLDKKADPNQLNVIGQSALQIAREKQADTIAEILVSHAQRKSAPANFVALPPPPAIPEKTVEKPKQVAFETPRPGSANFYIEVKDAPQEIAASAPEPQTEIAAVTPPPIIAKLEPEPDASILNELAPATGKRAEEKPKSLTKGLAIPEGLRQEISGPVSEDISQQDEEAALPPALPESPIVETPILPAISAEPRIIPVAAIIPPAPVETVKRIIPMPVARPASFSAAMAKPTQTEASSLPKNARVEFAEAVRVPLTTSQKPAAKAANPAFAPTGTYWIELGSFASDVLAREYFRHIAEREALDLAMDMRHENLNNGKSRVWLRVGSFTTAAQAEDLCIAFQQKQHSCIVVEQNHAPAALPASNSKRPIQDA